MRGKKKTKGAGPREVAPARNPQQTKETSMEPTKDPLRVGKCIVTLNGYDYEWPEPKRREAREQLADMAEIHQSMQSGGESAGIRAINKTLDFFYRHNRAMAQAQYSIDDATHDEIATAFTVISEMVSAPFRVEAEAAAAKNQTQGADAGAAAAE